MSYPMLTNSEEPYTLHSEIEDGRATPRSTRCNYTSSDVLENLWTKGSRESAGIHRKDAPP